MTSLQLLFSQHNKAPNVPDRLLKTYRYISVNKNIHSGWPHIKNTRILTLDVLKASLRENSIDTMLLGYSELGINVKKQAIEEALQFTIDWLHEVNEKTSSKTTE